uniref:Uncharacterized protein n=1 Tax=viral metagenome TaxID=1070528 RepID=A0A6C0B6N2_9ZZZZ
MTTTDVAKYQEHIQNLHNALTSNLTLINELTPEKLRIIIESYENLLKQVLDIED